MAERHYCSWCFEHGEHTLINKNRITRNVFQCENCGKETCKCMKCNQMTRRYPDHADKFCFKCKHLIEEWTESSEILIENLKIEARCSWCFKLTKHSMYSHNTATRNEYIVRKFNYYKTKRGKNTKIFIKNPFPSIFHIFFLIY